MKIKDKVKSHLSLWHGDIGEITGIIPIYGFESDIIIGELIHVLFYETDKHEAYQQSFKSSKYLSLIE